jgi:hypothetical protein
MKHFENSFLSGASVAQIAGLSTSLLEQPLAGAAALVVLESIDEGSLVGAFDRGLMQQQETMTMRYRRGTGGNAIPLRKGSLYLGLALTSAAALTPCSPAQVINRMVRPLLRVLTKCLGKRAAYFGRDTVVVDHAPVALVTMGHDSRSGRALFEAFIGPEIAHAFKSDAQIEIASAYLKAYQGITRLTPGNQTASALPISPSTWTAQVQEAIGTVGAFLHDDGTIEIGGQFMASRDAIKELNAKLANLRAPYTEEALSHLIDETFAPPTMLFGVRSLTSFRDCILQCAP